MDEKLEALLTIRKLAQAVKHENKACEIRPMDLLKEFSKLRENNEFLVSICENEALVTLIEIILLDIEDSIFDKN